MLSPASGPAVLRRDDDMVSLYVQTALSLWKSSLDGLALSRLASDLGQAHQKYVCTVHL
jgi:hypothetical protein